MERKDFKGLRSLRGIGAILIFYHHFGFEGAVIRSFGDFAVSLFFMLSGLVLAASFRPPVNDQSRPRMIGQFLRKRFLKIYPVYLLSLLGAVVLNGCNLKALPLDLLLLQSWMPLQEFYFSGNSVSWFVSSLFFSYLLFCPLMLALTAHPGRFLRVFLLGMVLYFMVVVSVPEPFVTGIIYISPVMELPAFILGMLVWMMFRRHPGEGADPTLVSLSQLASVGVIVGFIFAYGSVDPRWSLASYWWVPDFALLYILLVSEGHDTWLNRLLRLKGMQVMGDISFVFYLFHTIVIGVYRRFLISTGLELPMIPSSLLCLAATVVVSSLLHYRLELPLARWLGKRG